MAKPQVTHDELLQLMQYNQTTGAFTWKVDRRLGRYGNGHLIASAGDPVGGIDKTSGYVQMVFCRGRCRGHVLAVFYMTGQWPTGEVDHKNGVRNDNRWDNLRDVLPQVNKQNYRKARSDSRTGVQGVQWSSKKQKFAARVTTDGVCRTVGYFDSTASAHQAYVNAKREAHAGCTI